MTEPNSLVFVLGIDPGPLRGDSLAAWTVLSLDVDSGTVGVLRPAAHLSKASLEEILEKEPLVSDPRLRLATIAAPVTPTLLEKKPWKARAVEIRLSRGAFSGVERGPWMPWISNPRTWPRYQRAARLRAILESRGLPLLAMPAQGDALELPARSLAEVYPKATLALLSPRAPMADRPAANQFLGQLDDWLFPRLFTFFGSSSPSIDSYLAQMRLRLSFAVDKEVQRIAQLRRPFPRREPMRAFIAAFQGLLALRGSACLVGAPGEHEGSLLLPSVWDPYWQTEWIDARRAMPQLRRIPVHSLTPGVDRPAVASWTETESSATQREGIAAT